jgi:molybdopterin-guanine dinucleotide biosynthesis protein A
MGRDKAALVGADGRTLAARTAALLAPLADPLIEVGPGRSGATAVADGWPGAGPLAAVASGVIALDALGWAGPVLVVATDLPALEAPLLRWLADHPADATVIPVVDGRPQLLCARYDASTLLLAGRLVDQGCRRMQDLVDGRTVHLAGPEEWAGVAAAASFGDVDTPEAFAAVLDAGTGRGDRGGRLDAIRPAPRPSGGRARR